MKVPYIFHEAQRENLHTFSLIPKPGKLTIIYFTVILKINEAKHVKS